MNIPVPTSDLIDFIVLAKRATYAAPEQNAFVDPILPGSYQLEFRKGPFFYRDIYFGSDFFIGQETVYFNKIPIWGMCYAGGVNNEIDQEQCPELYSFLKTALRQVDPSAPYRGPEEYRLGKYAYTNRFLGQISRFSGSEMISIHEIPLYQLHYSGGILE